MISNWKKAAMVGTAGCAVLGVVSPALAVPPNDNIPQVLAGVGSDTTYDAMRLIDARWNTNTTVNPAASRDNAVTVAPQHGVGIFPASTFVPGDANCAPATFGAGGVAAPNGSSAGVTALINDTTGCFDYARSSRGRRSSDPATLQFWAFALDALTWSRFPGSNAPANLTQQQIIDIYTCDPATGVPKISDWSQVPGGKPGRIERYAPQAGSGTLGFWEDKILGGARVDTLNASCATEWQIKRTQESKGNEVATADRVNAIQPYSWGNYRLQAKTAAGRAIIAGAILSGINGKVPTPTTVNDGANRFFGTRYVYNVLKTTSPTYGPTLRFLGASPAGNGFVCNNGAGAQISAAGFKPLTRKAQGVGLPAGTCRLNPTAL